MADSGLDNDQFSARCYRRVSSTISAGFLGKKSLDEMMQSALLVLQQIGVKTSFCDPCQNPRLTRYGAHGYVGIYAC